MERELGRQANMDSLSGSAGKGRRAGGRIRMPVQNMGKAKQEPEMDLTQKRPRKQPKKQEETGNKPDGNQGNLRIFKRMLQFVESTEIVTKKWRNIQSYDPEYNHNSNIPLGNKSQNQTIKIFKCEIITIKRKKRQIRQDKIEKSNQPKQGVKLHKDRYSVLYKTTKINRVPQKVHKNG